MSSYDSTARPSHPAANPDRRRRGITAIPKLPLFGVGISAVTLGEACSVILAAARARRSYAVAALAVHGLVEAMHEPSLTAAVNSLDLVTPDGQPVRWALNLLHRAGLKDRVSGPDLTWRLCQEAAREKISLYIFGSTAETCARLVDNLKKKLPNLRIAGVQPDRFREATPAENAADIARINASGAGIVLVVRGCPRQEHWVAAHRGSVNAAMLAVGAAADFLAGTLRRAPSWMRSSGLEWLYRLAQEPRRLARRYAVTNTVFLLALARALARDRLRVPRSAAAAVTGGRRSRFKPAARSDNIADRPDLSMAGVCGNKKTTVR